MNQSDTSEACQHRLPIVGAAVLATLVGAILGARAWFVRFAAQ